jgi:acetolactate synthase-1/2/3 large subunit
MMMKVIQRELVDKTEIPILVDVGNAFSFSNRYLDFDEPGRYRVHFDFGAMGCAAAGVLGTCIATQKKAVAVVGDGAFLMQNEINTAVRYNLSCVWVVLNDARYGMVAQGLEALFGADRGSDFPPCNFVDLARSMGADGVRVETEADLSTALDTALKAKGPFVVDVLIDKRESAPSSKRFVSLARQGSQPWQR